MNSFVKAVYVWFLCCRRRVFISHDRAVSYFTVQKEIRSIQCFIIVQLMYHCRWQAISQVLCSVSSAVGARTGSYDLLSANKFAFLASVNILGLLNRCRKGIPYKWASKPKCPFTRLCVKCTCTRFYLATDRICLNPGHFFNELIC